MAYHYEVNKCLKENKSQQVMVSNKCHLIFPQEYFLEKYFACFASKKTNFVMFAWWENWLDLQQIIWYHSMLLGFFKCIRLFIQQGFLLFILYGLFI